MFLGTNSLELVFSLGIVVRFIPTFEADGQALVKITGKLLMWRQKTIYTVQGQLLTQLK